MDNSYKVYMHRTPSGKVYIGITKMDERRRWDNGRGYSEQVFGRAVAKYGWDNIEHTILEEGLSIEQACELEQEYIIKYRSQDSRFGYNVANGGNANSVSEETRNKLSKVLKGRKRPDLSKSKQGHIVSEVTRQKLSRAIKNKWKEGAYSPKPLSDAAKQKLREANLGKKASESTRQKISRSLQKSPPNTRKCQCVDSGVVYSSCSEAERSINNDSKLRGNINACCAGVQKSAYKLHWRYYDGE